MARQFASRLNMMWPANEKVTIDIVELIDGGETVHYQQLKATFAEDSLKQEGGPFEEISTKAVFVFSVQPQNGTLPTILEIYRVKYNDENLEVISANKSNGYIEEIEIVTEVGRL